MHDGEVKYLTHPLQLLTSEELGEMHRLKLMLRTKSREEARADLLTKRQKRLLTNLKPI